MKKILDNKITHFVFCTIEILISLVLIVLIVLTGFQRFSNQGNFFGYRIYTVASGSMEPKYGIGDTLLVEETEMNKLKVGDAVTYKGNKNKTNEMIITHEIVGIEEDDDGERLFHTKGLANNVEDPIVTEDQILGKVIHKFTILSILGKVTTSKGLLLVCVTVPLAFLIAIEIIKIVYKKDEEDEPVVEDSK